MLDSLSLLGQTVSHNRVIKKLGGAGWGRLRGRGHPPAPQCCAEFPTGQSSEKPAGVGAFSEREAQAAPALNHRHICTVYEVGEAEGQAFIAMECLEGATLERRISGKLLGLEARH
jgi:hypothetical protein